MTTQITNLAHLVTEVVEVNRVNGWYEREPSFFEAMALVHSEVSEALEAWRRWGVKDATEPCRDPAPRLAKPEGVGSEFADVFIRLLDYTFRFGVDLDAAYQLHLEHAGVFGIHDYFPDNADVLHCLVSRASERYSLGEKPDQAFAAILVFLLQLCELYDVDLMAEYRRKLKYNKTRGYRHGGKTI